MTEKPLPATPSEADEAMEIARRWHTESTASFGTNKVLGILARALLAARSERFPLCADCGCELECVKHGCAKKYDEHRSNVLEEAAIYRWLVRDTASLYQFVSVWLGASSTEENVDRAVREAYASTLKNVAPQVGSPARAAGGHVEADSLGDQVEPATNANRPALSPAESASQKDVITLCLRLCLEPADSHAPETREVLERYRPQWEAAAGGKVAAPVCVADAPSEKAMKIARQYVERHYEWDIPSFEEVDIAMRELVRIGERPLPSKEQT